VGTESIDYSLLIADLEEKRAKLDAALAALRAAQAVGALGIGVGDSMTMADSVSVVASGDVPVGAFLGKSIPEAAKLCLQMVKRKLTSREIAEYLKKGGIETASKTFPTLVHSILIRASRMNGSPIVKLDRSHWALASWYPALMRGSSSTQKQKRRRNANKTENSEPGAVSRIAKVLSGSPGTEFSAEDVAAPANVAIPVARLMLGRLVRSKQATKTDSGKYRASIVN
jgi:hypothetical protein